MATISPNGSNLVARARKAEERLQAAAKRKQDVTNFNQTVLPTSHEQINAAAAARIAAQKEYEAAEKAAKAANKAVSDYNRNMRNFEKEYKNQQKG